MHQVAHPFGSNTNTGTALLEGLHDQGNHQAWGYVVERYRPLLVGFGCRMGLNPTDAEDAAQTILMEFARGYGNGGYDRSKGRLRQWLFGIARKQIANCKRRRSPEHTPQRDTRTTAFFDRLPDEGQFASAWEAQWETFVMERALELVRAEVTTQTMDAFHLFAILGRPACDVAGELGISENAVFGAKRRVLARIREIIVELNQGE
jgi:RNA polymerase sigma-70 factor, ECF subfamily